MVADELGFGGEFAASWDGEDDLLQVIGAVAAVAAVAAAGVGCAAAFFAAGSGGVAGSGFGFEDQVLLDIGVEQLAALVDADFLAVVEHFAVFGAKSSRAVLALAEERLAAAQDPPAEFAAGGFAVFAQLHGSPSLRT